MRITFLMPHLKLAGGTRLSLTYAHFLAEKGHHVTVVVSSKNFWRRFLANILNIKPGWFKKNKAKFLRVKNFQAENIPTGDIVVACFWQGALFMSDYPQTKGKPIHFIQHDERLYHGPADQVTQAYRLQNKKIVLSHWLQERIRQDFNQHSDVLLTPVDFNLFHKVKANRQNKDKIRILSLHHSYIWKGTAVCVEVVKKIKDVHSEVELILYGAREKNIALNDCDEYYYNLPQEKMAELYSGCDIFICSSEWEGLGMPGMEAMACGTCLVTYDIGGSRDYAFDNETALVAKHADKEDLYKKILLAVEDKELREEIAQGGYDFIHNKIDTWLKSTDKLENIFLEILKT